MKGSMALCRYSLLQVTVKRKYKCWESSTYYHLQERRTIWRIVNDFIVSALEVQPRRSVHHDLQKLGSLRKAWIIQAFDKTVLFTKRKGKGRWASVLALHPVACGVESVDKFGWSTSVFITLLLEGKTHLSLVGI